MKFAELIERYEQDLEAARIQVGNFEARLLAAMEVLTGKIVTGEGYDALHETNAISHLGQELREFQLDADRAAKMLKNVEGLMREAGAIRERKAQAAILADDTSTDQASANA